MTHVFIRVFIFVCLSQSSKCVKKAMEGFVVGGRPSDVRENPHSVHLEANCHTHWTCGSAVLNQRILLTAAHCLHCCEISKGHRITASVGSANLMRVKIKRTVKRYVVHEKYDHEEAHNDIGLALLNKDIPFGANVKRVILAKRFPFDTKYGKVAGWGVVDEKTGNASSFLIQVSQKLRSKSSCKKLRLIPGMFCAGSENVYEDHPAAGDSGSALVTSNYIAIGLLSYRSDLYPALDVYTNITHYYDWVTKNAQDMYCSA